jgi:hypothetical protein
VLTDLSDQRFTVELHKDSRKSLTRSITQQLQSSGLLQQFPETLQFAAQLLQQLLVTDTTAAAAWAVAPAAAAADSPTPGSAACSSSASQSSGSRSNSAAGMQRSNLIAH